VFLAGQHDHEDAHLVPRKAERFVVTADVEIGDPRLRFARDEMRILMVVLTSEEHERDERFKREVLVSEGCNAMKATNGSEMYESVWPTWYASRSLTSPPQTTSYDEALRFARDEMRILMVVLTSEEHERDERFKREGTRPGR
jgi:hypothetical protein